MDDGRVEDEFDLSMEYDNVIIRWAVTNSSCEQATHGNRSKYACRSVNSDCKNVIHGKTFMGYRCKCSTGYTGNPYIQDGCTGTYLQSFTMCYNITQFTPENGKKINKFTYSKKFVICS